MLELLAVLVTVSVYAVGLYAFIARRSRQSARVRIQTVERR